MDRRSSRRAASLLRRSGVVGVLGLVLGLGWLAFRAERSHQIAAEQVLLDDARMVMPVLLPRRDGVHHDTVPRILAHLFQHQIHHRGQ
ncbi:MAG: hypothetical protein ACXWLF_08590, partial [Myxococcaceae bacterium]